MQLISGAGSQSFAVMPLNYGKGTCCSRFSHSKQGFQLRRLWSYNQSAPNQSAATGCCFVRVFFWVFVCFGSFVLFGQAHVLTLLLRIRHGDLCLSAHIAPLPVQKKPNQSAANTAARAAMWPQIVGRSILTRDYPRTPRTLEQTLERSLFLQGKFFARVEALCVQVLHKSPWSS